ncbi:MAG: glycoside hydrolase family 65 protein, partial [Demequinaceae bacterium]|nr:glycoside hydrolase family 65 protein [Demequinaceae bacterium]
MAHLFDVDPWVVSTTSLDPHRIRLLESITSIGNGYMGMRGNFEEGYGGDSHLGTYIAGVWYPDPTKVGWWKNGYPLYFGKAINAVNFAGIGVEVNGEALDLFSVPFSDIEIRLDMLRGLLTRSFRCEVGGVTLSVHAERFLSIVTPQLSFQRLSIEVESGEGVLRVAPRVDGRVHNLDSNYGEQFWHEVGRSSAPAALSMRTNPNSFGTPQFTVTAAMACAVAGLSAEETRSGELMVEEPFQATVATGSAVELIKTVAVVTSRDVDDAQHVARAAALLHEAAEKDYEVHRAEQESAWAKRWAQADVEI